MTPRVLALVTFRIYPTLMGGQKGVALFYAHLQKRLDVCLALSKNNELPRDSAVPANAVLNHNRQLFLNLFRIGVLKKLAKHQKADIIIAEHSYAGWMAWLLRKSTGLPFIIHSHNIEALRFKHMRRRWWRLYWHYEKWVHQKADFNFFISAEDQAYALQHFGLSENKCAVITYGVEPFKISLLKEDVSNAIELNHTDHLLFFNGTLDYAPNYEAVFLLGNEIVPRLKTKISNFKILISGNRITPELKRFIGQQPDLLFLDYVPDVAVVYQAAQLFLNPIMRNTGVKTKVLEAVANHCTVVSTASGAAGICKAVCGSKLVAVNDGDWDGFAACISEQLLKTQTPTPPAFFDSYLWDNIARKAAAAITDTAQRHNMAKSSAYTL